MRSNVGPGVGAELQPDGTSICTLGTSTSVTGSDTKKNITDCHTSVATARLGPLAAQLKQLSRFCGSDSCAEPISVAPEWLRAAQSGLAVQI